MDVILIKDVDSLGEQGQVVKVADGFARNFLLPKKMAIRSGKGPLKDLESRREQLAAKAEKRYQENKQRAEVLEKLGEITLEASVGEEGKLFGTITPKDLAMVIDDKTGLQIDRRNLLLNKPINRLGRYELTLRLSPRVSAKLNLLVLPADPAVLKLDVREAFEQEMGIESLIPGQAKPADSEAVDEDLEAEEAFYTEAD